MKKIFVLTLLVFTNLVFSQIITIKHTAYEIKFDLKLKQPISTHYVLTKQNALKCLSSNVSRSNFHSDSLICVSCQSSRKTYAGVSDIYDKGHLAPDDDFRWSVKTEREAMLFDNQSFQVYQFNRGIWKSLENYVRKIAEKYDVDVTTGVIYGTKVINGFLVPDYYWKTIKYNGVIESWKIPNKIPKKNDSFNNYGVIVN
jgi:endonuclease G